MAMIEARGLTKAYRSKSGPVHALTGLDLTVPEGTVKALLGPNGSGKTTTVKMLTTLERPDEGSAAIAGIDVLADPQAVRRTIGVSGQYAAVDENLTGFENLDMIGRLYHLGAKVSRERARELIDVFDLAAAGDRPVKGFSGGMRRRIDLAGALVTNPRVLFLDEPTTGLDPRSRLALWEIITSLVAGGTTVLLTTQYLEEADRLADDISVIDEGRVIAEGTADQLKAQVGGHRLVVAARRRGPGGAGPRDPRPARRRAPRARHGRPPGRGGRHRRADRPAAVARRPRRGRHRAARRRHAAPHPRRRLPAADRAQGGRGRRRRRPRRPDRQEEEEEEKTANDTTKEARR